MADEWNYETSITWNGPAAAFGEGYPVFVNSVNFYQADTPLAGGQAAALAINVERVGLPLLGEGVVPSAMKLITGLWLVVVGEVGTTLTVYVGAQRDTPQDPVTWDGPFTYTIGETEFIDPYVEGRYAAIRISSNAATPWTIVSYQIDFEVSGIQ